MTSGIYQIRHCDSGKCYVGSAVCLADRWRKHRQELARGVHCNQRLQRAWLKYGAEAFEFLVLERVERSGLIEREQFWIDRLRAAVEGYNILPTAGSCLGRTHSAETRRKMSAWQIGRKLPPETVAKILAARAGYTASPETRAKLSASGKGRPKSADWLAKHMAKARNWKPSAAMLERARQANVGRKFSPEIIAKRVATRAHNKALRLAAQAVAA